MLIIPAIDLKNGQCVRLEMGEFDTAHTVADCPVETAKRFYDAGARLLHVVDLDAAKGDGENLEIVRNIVENTGISVELGGGLRDMQSLDAAFGLGIFRAVIGSAAVKDPAFLDAAIQKYGERIAVGIDAKNGLVRISGWCQGTDLYSVDFARKASNSGVKYIAFTDISRDGMLSGPNFRALSEMQAAVTCQLIASGGVSTIDDLVCLRDMGIYGAIVGKAIYTGDIDLREAISQCSYLKNPS